MPSRHGQTTGIKLRAPGLSMEHMAGDTCPIKQVVLILVERAISLS